MTYCYPRRTALYVGLFFKTPPISTNAIWRSFIRNGKPTTIKSANYRDWCLAAGAELEAQNPCRVEGAYGLRIMLKKGCRLDLDNSVKAFSDLIVSHGVVIDDRHMQNLEVKRGQEEATLVQVISTRESE